MKYFPSARLILLFLASFGVYMVLAAAPEMISGGEEIHSLLTMNGVSLIENMNENPNGGREIVAPMAASMGLMTICAAVLVGTTMSIISDWILMTGHYHRPPPERSWKFGRNG